MACTAIGADVTLAAAFSRSEPIPRRRQASVIGLRVREHLVAFLSAKRSSGGDVLLGIANQAQQRGAPPWSIGFEDGELLGCGLAVSLGFDVQVELPGSDRGGR